MVPEIQDPEQPRLPAVSEGEVAPAVKARKLTLIPLIFLIYFEVAGGPYGEEPAVQAAGPLLALIGFLVFPFIWSIPEALMTAELSTAFPGDGGFVLWAEQAFGPFFGSLMGTWKLLSGIINIAAFPVLCIDYMEKLFTVFSSGLPRQLGILVFTLLLSFLNYLGLTIVGYFAVALGIVSLMPFILMSAIAVPKVHPRRWLSLGDKDVKKDWNLYFNTLFWNLNFWDNVSTLAGEVDRPQKTFPTALFFAIIFTCVAYIIPLFAVTGAVDVPQSLWETGFHADAAEIIAGKWLKVWIEVGAVLSAIGLFEAQLSSSSYQLLGMADLGMIPAFFSNRSWRFNTPWVGIVFSTAVCIGVSYMDFEDIVASANLLYSLGMLLEFASFLWLRRKLPQLERPFRVPLGLRWLAVMCVVPSSFLVVIIVLAKKIVYLVTGLMTVGGIGFYFLMKFCRDRKVFRFSNGGEDDHNGDSDTDKCREVTPGKKQTDSISLNE
ncbi:hypothetical protein SAY86_020371 [Trapa natans]|uniref:Uncharacterized protein n=1 Tax=Trapa natans TaxID=22666 RepID=A0AAN7LZ90_TRANT|nr:hypothetical protein SAY86_020371 [Trapa natans]